MPPKVNTSSLLDHPKHRVSLFAFRLLKHESNHEHELSWARKIHMTVPFHSFRVFLLLSDSLKLKAPTSMNCPGLVKYTRQYHFIYTSASSLTHEEVPPRSSWRYDRSS